MGFMTPHTHHMKAFILNTSDGKEIIPYDVLSSKEENLFLRGYFKDAFRDYVSAKEICYVEIKTAWFARLGADGYMDCTEYSGPFNSEKEALEYVMKMYEVNENGNS